VPSDEHIFLLGQAENPGEVVLGLRKSHLFHLRSPALSNHALASGLRTIASTSTRTSTTS
jgi:hypothetical protein